MHISDIVYMDCPWCGIRHIAMEFRQQAPTHRAEGQVRWWVFLTCPRCAGAVVREFSPVAESKLDVDGSPVMIEVLQTVPASGQDIGVLHLPDDVQRYYRNAIRAFRADLPDAAAVELRRTLEAATMHFGINHRTLVERVHGLIEAGLVTKQFGQVLTHIRKVGNLGAHATDERVSLQEAERALRFTTQVLRNLFEIPSELAAVNQPVPSDSSSVGTRSLAEGAGAQGDETAASQRNFSD